MSRPCDVVVSFEEGEKAASFLEWLREIGLDMYCEWCDSQGLPCEDMLQVPELEGEELCDEVYVERG